MSHADDAPGERPHKHVVIACHPETESFTLSVARAYCDAVRARGHQAILRDLYRTGFDPVLKAAERLPAAPFAPSPDVAEELALLDGADAFVLVYPLWFGTPPAMLKGYIERVLGAGFSREMMAGPMHRPHHKLLGGKHLLSFSSSGASKHWLEDQKAWISLQTIFDGYLARAFWMDTPEHVHFGEVVESMDPATAAEHLRRVAAEADSLCDRIAPR